MLRAIVFCLLALTVSARSETATVPAKPETAAAVPVKPETGTRRVRSVMTAEERAALDVLIERHATANAMPVAFVRHVIRRESNFNPRAVDRGNYGLMQIRLGTAHALGYRGDAVGLLDPDVNMTYGMRYLAGAYRAAHGDEARTIVFYSRGYYGR
jgi:soluble lytic murein transglycosylase-like protein